MLIISGATTKVTRNSTPATARMARLMAAGRLSFSSFPFQGRCRSMLRIGTLRTKAMAAPRIKGEAMCTRLPKSSSSFR